MYSDLEQLSRVIMEGHQGDEYDEALSTLAELEDIGWKVRLCLMDTQRALNFLVRKARLPGGQLEQAREILRDIESLLPHNESLFQTGNSTVAFTIRDGRLFTLRERELPAFRLYRMRARSQSMVDGNAYELLLDLFETKIEQLADEIENIYSDLEQLSRVIMEGHQGD
ncbi:CorA family divalent cation transporter, partial [Escherichia coli]|uniref:CorA family divalent cation transporter n=1 Tax=Escherichia coli TaxID=562 RepID=UPI00286F23F3